MGRGIPLLFHDRGTRRGWVVSSTPRPHFTPWKEPVPILQEAGWAPGPVWTGGKSRPHRDSIPDRPARSQSLYRLSYPTYNIWNYTTIKQSIKKKVSVHRKENLSRERNVLWSNEEHSKIQSCISSAGMIWQKRNGILRLSRKFFGRASNIS